MFKSRAAKTMCQQWEIKVAQKRRYRYRLVVNTRLFLNVDSCKYIHFNSSLRVTRAKNYPAAPQRTVYINFLQDKVTTTSMHNPRPSVLQICITKVTRYNYLYIIKINVYQLLIVKIY